MVVREMLETHPVRPEVDMLSLAECIEHCYECAQSCVICADACLGEDQLDMLIRCIRLNQDCADVCDATGRLLSRVTTANWSLLLSQLQTCADACKACGDECEKHADRHEHCRICAEACRRCEDACRRVKPVMAA
jgi:hypothetical protein